ISLDFTMILFSNAYCYELLSFMLIPRHPRLLLFPYTTLFRSVLVVDSHHFATQLEQRRFLPDAGAVDVHAFAVFMNRNAGITRGDRKSTRLNSSHVKISYAVFCLKKKKQTHIM